MSAKLNFIICAPLQALAQSNGILSLLKLGQALQARGRKVFFCISNSYPHEEHLIRVDIATYQTTDSTHLAFLTDMRVLQHKYGIEFMADFSQQAIDRCYVIYPEVILGNPLNAPHVIRYFGNKDGILKQGKTVQIGASDFVLAHSKVIYPGAHHVLFFSLINRLFHDRDAPPTNTRTLDVTYIGKGNLFGEVSVLDNTLGIARTWPSNKDELATLLRHSRFFYTWDSWTQINVEALYCGAIPVFLRTAPWTDAEIDGTELGPLPRLHGDSVLEGNFFEEFEVLRRNFIDRIERVMMGWERGVDELLEKVDAHF